MGMLKNPNKLTPADKLRDISSIDTKTFNWHRKPTADPEKALHVIAEINKKIYLLTCFDIPIKKRVDVDLESFAEALNLSVQMAHPLLESECFNIAKLSQELDIPFELVTLFTVKGYKGKKTFDTLIKASSLSAKMLNYIDKKSLPIGTIAILNSFSPEVAEFVIKYLESKNPSVQEAKKFIEKAADYRDDIAKIKTYSDSFTFPDERKTDHIEIDRLLDYVEQVIDPVKITPKNSYESSEMTFSFTASSVEEYEEAVTKLNEGTSTVSGFFRGLKNRDIC